MNKTKNTAIKTEQSKSSFNTKFKLLDQQLSPKFTSSLPTFIYSIN